MKGFLVLTFTVFPSVSTTVLSSFPCRKFDDGSNLLKADFSIDCDASTRDAYVAYAALMVLVYPVGITLLYTTILWKERHLICPEERPWHSICGIKLIPPLAASITDEEALLRERKNQLLDNVARKNSTEHTTYSHFRATSFLFDGYEPRYWWFEIFECVRRLMITGGTVFFLEGSATQVAVGVLISLVSIHVYAFAQPFIEGSSDVLALTAQWGIFLTLFLGLLLKTGVAGHDGYDDTLGGLLVFVNAAVIVIAVGEFIYGNFRSSICPARENVTVKEEGKVMTMNPAFGHNKRPDKTSDPASQLELVEDIPHVVL
jgi:hypothetical protein